MVLRLGVLLLWSVSAWAADDHLEGTGDKAIEQPLLRPKLGLKVARTPFPISGLTPAAQAHFNQASAALHGFWIFEAERNYRECIRLQPDHPIPYAFAAYAQWVFGSGDTKRGALYLKEANAKQRAAKYALTESESLWMQAINARYDTTIKAEDRAKRF
ncbi:hypothetical protein K2X33_15005, partial [bacterium]|nr:hypothetical protein [bacterium]